MNGADMTGLGSTSFDGDHTPVRVLAIDFPKLVVMDPVVPTTLPIIYSDLEDGSLRARVDGEVGKGNRSAMDRRWMMGPVLRNTMKGSTTLVHVMLRSPGQMYCAGMRIEKLVGGEPSGCWGRMVTDYISRRGDGLKSEPTEASFTNRCP